MSPATKLWLLLTTLFISVATQAQDLSRALWGAPISELRTKAEVGDQDAQCNLAAAYAMRYDGKTNATYWYRKAAKQGNAEGQFGLARLLPKTEDEKWFLLAANQNHFAAQQVMAGIWEDRHKDKVEACKWTILYVNQRPNYRPYLDQLALKMTSSEFAEAQKRAAVFVPTKPIPIEPELKLQSIIGTPTHRLALINGHTFATGEQAQLKIDGDSVSAKCIGITDSTATIEVNGTRRTLTLQ